MSVFALYLFALCSVASTQYDDLSILEEVLERSTSSVGVTAEPEFTVKTSSEVTEVIIPGTPEISATVIAVETVGATSNVEKEEEEMETIGVSEEEQLSTITAAPEHVRATTAEANAALLAITTPTVPKEKAGSTKNPSIEEVTEIPHVEKEPVIGHGKEDLSRIYRKLFPYRTA